MKKSAGKDKNLKKSAAGKQASDELTSDDEDIYGYYH